jgi:hypothetical protein
MGEVITALGLILGALVAYMQVQRNQRASLQLQETHLRNELKLKLYERFSATMAEASAKVSKASTQYYSVISSLSLRLRNALPVSPTEVGIDLSDRVFAAHSALIGVANVLEEYEILFSRFGGFRREIFDACSRLLDTHTQLSSKLLLFQPMRNPETQKPFGPLVFPTEEQLAEIERLHRSYTDVCNDLSSYMVDLQIETQNELLGDLFQRQLPPRHLGDPNMKVLRRDDAEMTERPKGRLV